MILHVVEMLRSGSREKHSYVIGVYTDRENAELAGEVHSVWRGGKYIYAITRVELDDGPSVEELRYYQQCTQVDSVSGNIDRCDPNES